MELKIIAYILILPLSIIIFVSLFYFGPEIESEKFFFMGVAYCLAASILSFSIAFIAKLFVSEINTYDCIIIALTTFSISLLFFTHVPVTADRSVSIYLLARLDASGKVGLSESEINQALINDYIIKRQATRKRLTEQAEVGTINSNNGVYTLSEKGRRLLIFYRAVARCFKIQRGSIKNGEEDGR